ncbi:MAG: cation transporter [Anaerolineaceae bacterium]
MDCPHCVMILEGLEDKQPCIKSISASYRQGNMVVEFDPELVSEGEILAAVERLGYRIEK